MRKLIWKVILLFLGAVLLLGVLFLIVTSIFLTLLFQTRTTVSHDLSYYPIAAGQVESEKGYPPICEALPALSELEPYENLEFSHVRKKYGIFQSDSYILQLQYTEQDYLAAAEKLSKRYTFCTEPVPNHGSQEIALSFSIGDFYFRPVETDGTWEFFFRRNCYLWDTMTKPVKSSSSASMISTLITSTDRSKNLFKQNVYGHRKV